MTGLKNVRQRHRDALSRTGWEEVERMLAAHYRAQGWQVEHCGTAGTGGCFDGGIDLKLLRDDALVLVQCKHWNAKQVPHNEVHQLLGLMVNEGATGAILVTSGEFTHAAREAAARLGHVQLVDGHGLRAMLGRLPEPVPDPVEVIMPSMPLPATADARTRELSSLEFRTSRRHPRHAPSTAVPKGLLWALASLGFVLAMVLIFREILGRSAGSAGPEYVPPSPRKERIIYVDPQGRELPAPAVGDGTPVVDWRADATGSTGPSPGQGCHEIIDAATVSYIDHCANATPGRTPTAAEIRAAQRRADEAMKVIESHTPQM